MEEVKQEHTHRSKREIKQINLLAFKDPKSPVAEAYRTIRTNLQFSGVDKEMKVVEVTSAVPNEGKSTVIASLAVVLAQARKKCCCWTATSGTPPSISCSACITKGLTTLCPAERKTTALLFSMWNRRIWIFWCPDRLPQTPAKC